MNSRTPDEEVNISKKLEVAAATLASTPNSNIRGAITIPPPTPNIPDITPPNTQITIILFIFFSPSTEFNLKSVERSSFSDFEA